MFPNVWEQNDLSTYHPVVYNNKTDSIEEILCIGVSDYIDISVCGQTSPFDLTARVVPSTE